MPTRTQCPVCTHSQRERIECALVGGYPPQAIADTYGLPVWQLRAHQKQCMRTIRMPVPGHFDGPR